MLIQKSENNNLNIKISNSIQTISMPNLIYFVLLTLWFKQINLYPCNSKSQRQMRRHSFIFCHCFLSVIFLLILSVLHSSLSIDCSQPLLDYCYPNQEENMTVKTLHFGRLQSHELSGPDCSSSFPFSVLNKSEIGIVLWLMYICSSQTPPSSFNPPTKFT